MNQIHNELGPKGLTVLGFPSTTFKQEAKDPEKVASAAKNHDTQF